MRRQWIWICVIALMGVPLWAQDDKAIKREREEMVSEQRVALVIGNAAYKKVPLRNPVNDAESMAAALKAYGFNVLKYTDLNRKEMLKVVRRFGYEIKRGGVGLFYYSGHGIQVDGQNYLVPVDVDIEEEDEVESECLGVKQVLKKMETAGNRVNILILDACRNNEFETQYKSSGRGGGLAGIEQAPRGSFIAYATAPGKLARDGAGFNSPFTAALLMVMPEQGLKIEEVFKKVRSKVMDETADKQVPWDSSSLTGDFYFVLPPVSPPPSPPPTPPQSWHSGPNTQQRDYQAGMAAFNRYDYETAVEKWQPLADQKNAKAQYKLGEMNYKGLVGARKIVLKGGLLLIEFGKKNYPEAENWFLKAANQGHVEAQYKLGKMYSEPTEYGVKNDEEAEKWFLKAADQGHVEAQYKLGEMYYKCGEMYYERLVEGEGLLMKIISFIGLYDPSQDYTKEVVEWFHKAANHGFAKAQYKLGDIYYTGHGVPEDYVQAHIWFNLAAAQGMQEALSKLKEVEKKMTPTETATAQRQAHEFKKR